MNNDINWIELEEAFSIKIPSEVKSFYDKFPEDLAKTGLLINGVFYPITERCLVDRQRKLLEINREARMEEDLENPSWPPFMFAIGLDGTDFYAINTADFDGRVFFWNCDEGSFKTVANSIAEFKNDLVESDLKSEFGHVKT